MASIEKLIKQAVAIRTKINATKAKRVALPKGPARTKLFKVEADLAKQLKNAKAKIAKAK